MPKNKIYPFSRYILRVPAYSLSNYLNLLDNFSDHQLLNYIKKDSYFKEAIKIASTDLLTEVYKWLEKPDSLSNKKKEKLKFSILKYISRISTRPTPFGLFAGCSVGTLDKETSIIINTKEHFNRSTQFDMQFWVSFLENIANKEDVKPYLIFYPNNSIYIVADFYRYNEYETIENKRLDKIVAVRRTEYLDKLYENAKQGLTIREMVDLLTEIDSEEEEAHDYINQLINSQFLVSNLNSTITGEDELGRIYGLLNYIPSLADEIEILKAINNQLILLDSKIVPFDEVYMNLDKLVTRLNIPYNKNYLFQTDINITSINNSLNSKLNNQIIDACILLNSIKQHSKSNNLNQFIDAFAKRYETREMPISIVLDGEIGIGYLQNSNDSHPILDKFSFNKNKGVVKNEKWTNYDFILQKKLHESIVNKTNHIELCEKDFDNFESNLDEFPPTFSVMVGLIKNNDEEQIVLEAVSGISAAKLLGRFCNINSSINDLTKEIIQKEVLFYDDKIIAEIVHIPESRTGNILRRPVLRKYEIPYLCNSAVEKEFQIEISDLMVSVKNNRIVLKSKKLNKEVIPSLSNAHNYHENSLPIYQFLCDLQSQDLKPIHSFNWSVLEQHYNYFPRVIYKNVILSKAKWKVARVEINSFYSQSESELFENFALWKNQRNIPRYVNWIHYDNTLLVDLETEIGIQLFLKSIKKFDAIIIEEFLFNEDAIVKNIIGESFTNQIIMSFYNEKVN